MNENPIFIVTLARHGSTLLRYILDTHEDVEVPQELEFARYLRELDRFCRLLFEVEGEGGESEEMYQAMRRSCSALLGEKLQKPIWCDKSLGTSDHLDLLSKVYPDGRYVMLYRHCMDFLFSALEVCRYGINGFGFANYLLKNPKNFIDQLARFWCDKTKERLDFEERSGMRCRQLRYEDIVERPEVTTRGLFEFLEIDFDPELLERVFDKNRKGRGDHKIRLTKKIEPRSLGKGRMIPINRIEDDTLIRMNGLLERLGYESVCEDWNVVDARGERKDDSHGSSVGKLLGDHFVRRMSESSVPIELHDHTLRFEIVGEENSWLFKFGESSVSEIRGTSDHTLSIRLGPQTAQDIISGSESMSIAATSGRIHMVGDGAAIFEAGKYLFSNGKGPLERIKV